MTRNLITATRLLDEFNKAFYNWPTESKPPIDQAYKRDDSGEVIGVELQLALAGFKEEFIQVYTEGSVLVLAGDNRADDSISAKFRCSFERSLSLTKYYDPSKTDVTFVNGLLTVFVPVAEHERKKTFLFGN